MSTIPAAHITQTPLLNTGDADAKRAEVRQYFLQTWELYEKLFTVLADDSVYYERPEPLRHPLIFYFGHTATFFSNKLVVSKILDRRIRPNIESMMAIGVDEMSWDDLDESHYDWPTVDEVRAYRDEVKAIVLNFIDTLPLTLPIQWEDPFWIILMGIEHERIHLETSSVLIRQLPLSKLHHHSDCPDWPHFPLAADEDDANVPQNTLLSVPGGSVTQGRDHPASTYGWDNEYGHLQTKVPDFKASKFLVSNRDFYAFIKDGGYENKELWTEEGWNWVQYKKARHPAFWVPQTDDSTSFQYRTLLAEIDMPWSWPVDANYLEAKAFCNWLSKKKKTSIRLPSEPEWYRLSELCIDYDEGGRIVSDANIELKHWASSCPIDTYQHREFYDVTGNVWQWTETAIDGFDGFAVHPAYDDFSVPTFDGRHNMIKGGSWITTGNESHHDSRYAFRRHFTQHAGFRYVESENEVDQEFNTYETDPLIAQYLEFHFGTANLEVPNFPKACVDSLIETIKGHTLNRVLDVGCAVGRSSFELAKHVTGDGHIDAVDVSTRFIRNALALADHGSLRYLITEEGDIQNLKTISLDELNLADHADRIQFTQGDAGNLKPIYQGYDLIFAGNLIDHLYEPAAFLRNVHDRLNSGGILVLTSISDWDESRTKKENWLGGIKINGENKTTLDGLYEMLATQLNVLAEPQDIPYVMRKTARKYEHSIAQMTYWVKKEPCPLPLSLA